MGPGADAWPGRIAFVGMTHTSMFHITRYVYWMGLPNKEACNLAPRRIHKEHVPKVKYETRVAQTVLVLSVKTSTTSRLFPLDSSFIA